MLSRVQSSQLIVHFLLPHLSLLENFQPIPFDWALSQSSQRWHSVAFPSWVSDQQKCAWSCASRQTGVSSELSPCPWKSCADCVSVCERVYILPAYIYIYTYTIILNMCLDFIFKLFFLKCETLIIPIFFDMERGFDIGKIGEKTKKKTGWHVHQVVNIKLLCHDGSGRVRRMAAVPQWSKTCGAGMSPRKSGEWKQLHRSTEKLTEWQNAVLSVRQAL